MLEYGKTYVIKGRVPDVVAVAMDRKRDVRVYRDITAVEILRWDQTETEIDLEFKSVANGNIPPMFRKIVTPNMLTWMIHGHWDLVNYVYTNETKPLYFSNIFTGRGTQKFIPEGDDKTRWESKFFVNIRMPALGNMAERLIAKTQMENLDLASKILEEDVAEYVRNKK